MAKFKVKFINDSSMTIEANNRNHAYGLARKHGMVSDIKPACSKLWLLVFPVVAMIGCLFFKVLSGQL